MKTKGLSEMDTSTYQNIYTFNPVRIIHFCTFNVVNLLLNDLILLQASENKQQNITLSKIFRVCYLNRIKRDFGNT